MQYQSARALFEQVKIATDAGHPLLTAAPEGVRAVLVTLIIVRRGSGQTRGFWIVVNQHAYHVSHSVCFYERGGQLSWTYTNIMHGGLRHYMPRPLHQFVQGHALR